jgi:hypothetical protein
MHRQEGKTMIPWCRVPKSKNTGRVRLEAEGLAPTPEFVGLSQEERRYLEERQDAWRGYFAGDRPATQ